MTSEKNILSSRPACRPAGRIEPVRPNRPFRRLPFLFPAFIEGNDIGFILVNPFVFFPDYEFNLTAEESEVLDIKKPDEEIRSFVSLTPAGV